MIMLDAVLARFCKAFVQDAGYARKRGGEVVANVEFSVKVDNIQEVLQEKNEAVAAILETIGLHLEGESKEELENDPRRVDTGRLKNSITHVVDITEPAVYVGTNVEYAPYVHFGTKNMQPNEFIKNAFERNEDQIRVYIENGLKNA